MELRPDFGKFLRELRKTFRMRNRTGLTIPELAEKLEIAPSTLGRIERGTRFPALNTFKKIETFFEDYEDEWLVKKIVCNDVPSHFLNLPKRASFIAQRAIGELISAKRTECGKSLRQLADASGVSKSTMSRIEHGRVISNKLFEILETDVDRRKISVTSTGFAHCLGFDDEIKCNEWLDKAEVNWYEVDIHPAAKG